MNSIIPVVFFFLIKGVELGPRPKVTRGPPLDKWEEFLDAEGRVMNPEHIKKLVFKGVKFMNFFFFFFVMYYVV